MSNESTLPDTVFNKIILELPPLVSSPIPMHLVSRSAVSILILTLHTLWGRRDKQLYAQYLKTAKQQVLVALNKVEDSNTDAPSLNDMEQGLIRESPYNAPTAASRSTKKEKALNR
ncbi:hypothetical protein [Spirosoma telluris]|uniref:hypothetical protein n=1 Tax=Spirosoma telluris TaxID=2183553 RepID=UPI002FC37E05